MAELPAKFTYLINPEGDYYVPVTVQKQPDGSWLETADDGNEIKWKNVIPKKQAEAAWAKAQEDDLISRGGEPLTKADKRKLAIGTQDKDPNLKPKKAKTKKVLPSDTSTKNPEDAPKEPAAKSKTAQPKARRTGLGAGKPAPAKAAPQAGIDLARLEAVGKKLTGNDQEQARKLYRAAAAGRVPKESFDARLKSLESKANRSSPDQSKPGVKEPAKMPGQTKPNTASPAGSAAPPSIVSPAQLKAFASWAKNNAPEGSPIRDQAVELYQKAKAGKISAKEFSQQQGKLVAAAKANAGAAPSTEPKPAGSKAAAFSTPKDSKPAGSKPAGSKPADSEPAKEKPGVKSVPSNPKAKTDFERVQAEEAAKGAAKGATEGFAGRVKDALTKPLSRSEKVVGGLAYAPAVGARGVQAYKDVMAGKDYSEVLGNTDANVDLVKNLATATAGVMGGRVGAALPGPLKFPGAILGGVATTMAADKAIGKGLEMVGYKKSDAPETDDRKAKTSGSKPEQDNKPAFDYTQDEVLAEARKRGWRDDVNVFDTTSSAGQNNQRILAETMEDLARMQSRQVEKYPEVEEEIRRATPVNEYFQFPEGSEELAEEAVKAPIGEQEENDVLKFLMQPDNEQLLAELAARQTKKIETAGRKQASGTSKKIERTVDPANDRPVPRFYVDTGRFGAVEGAGSRRSPDRRLR